MQVERKFSPLKIVIESEEELSFIRETIMKANQLDKSSRFLNMPDTYRSRSKFQEKLDYLLGLLK